MEELQVANGNHSPEQTSKANGTPNGTLNPPKARAAQKKPRKNGRRPPYAQIHSKPLPLQIYPLPAFHPSNPLSLLRLAFVYLSQVISPPPLLHSEHRYIGYISPETRSVHVTDPVHMRALWEMGFFGKGTLSRSEPSWIQREMNGKGGAAAEEYTKLRREERRMFKLERARVERERIDRQRAVEEGKLTVAEEEPVDVEAAGDDVLSAANGHVNGSIVAEKIAEPLALDAEAIDPQQAVPKGCGLGEAAKLDARQSDAEEPEAETTIIQNEEHLQLTLEEAFFLHYGLGVLDVRWSAGHSGHGITRSITKSSQLLQQFHDISANTTTTADITTDTTLVPDNPFLINYVVYHHFRSLGWVVRGGMKFGVDYLLYNRGPVFSHAEFAVVIVPSYSHPHWSSSGAEKHGQRQQKDWWWLHGVNRVQSQVKKTLVLCYVDVPPPASRTLEEKTKDGREMWDVGALLGTYRVREIVVKRWLGNRNRD